MSAYIKSTERSQINDLMLRLKLLEKQEQAKTQKKQERQMDQENVEFYSAKE
jgi:hypothetical protein